MLHVGPAFQRSVIAPHIHRPAASSARLPIPRRARGGPPVTAARHLPAASPRNRPQPQMAIATMAATPATGEGKWKYKTVGAPGGRVLHVYSRKNSPDWDLRRVMDCSITHEYYAPLNAIFEICYMSGFVMTGRMWIGEPDGDGRYSFQTSTYRRAGYFTVQSA